MHTNLEEDGYTSKYEKYTKQWLSPDDLAIEYGFSKSTQAKMRMHSSTSTIPYSKIGKYVRYKRELIHKWLDNHQIQGI